MPVLVPFVSDVPAVLGDRRAYTSFDQLLDLLDDVGVRRIFLDFAVRIDVAENKGAPLMK